jgi:hypothetical protein
MYLPNMQPVLTAGLAMTGTLTKRSPPLDLYPSTIPSTNSSQHQKSPRARFSTSQSRNASTKTAINAAASHSSSPSPPATTSNGAPRVTFPTPLSRSVTLEAMSWSTTETRMASGLQRRESWCTWTSSQRSGRREMILLSTRLLLASKQV